MKMAYDPIKGGARTLSSIFGVDSEDSRLVDSPVDETWAVGTDVATVHVVHIKLQRTSC